MTVTTSGFSAFDFAPAIARGISDLGFTEPRPIQEKTLAASLRGEDIMGLAQTGTGKTAAFVLPMLQYLSEDPGAKGPRGLVVAPTRELASQIVDEFEALARHTRLKCTAIFGGVGINPQIKALKRGTDVIVACPGRLLDLLNREALTLDRVEILVLDEADHMLDMGFLPDIKRILRRCPDERQTMLFSATMPKEIRGLASDILVDPLTVELAHSKPVDSVEHALLPVLGNKEKVSLLYHLLKTEEPESAIVFTRTKHRAKRLARKLEKSGYRATALQGNMSQGARTRAMDGFRECSYDILVATDIAARGIDVAQVSHVINFDLPNTTDAYTHRIGRTGRSDRRGEALSFVTSEDLDTIRALHRVVGDIEIRQIEGYTELDFSIPGPRRQQRAADGGRGQRGGGGGRGQHGDGGGGGGRRRRRRRRPRRARNSTRHGAS